MYKIKNFMDNDDVKVIDSLGAFSVVEYQKDLSVMPNTVMTAYISSLRQNAICQKYMKYCFVNKFPRNIRIFLSHDWTVTKIGKNIENTYGNIYFFMLFLYNNKTTDILIKVWNNEIIKHYQIVYRSSNCANIFLLQDKKHKLHT